MENLNQDLKNDWGTLYQEEHLKNADLAGRIADLEAQKDDLQFKLDRIKSCGKPLHL